MITKRDIIQMARATLHDNVYNLDYYRNRIKFVDDYQPSKPTTKFKTDQERVKELQKKNNNYKDIRS